MICDVLLQDQSSPGRRRSAVACRRWRDRSTVSTAARRQPAARPLPLTIHPLEVGGAAGDFIISCRSAASNRPISYCDTSSFICGRRSFCETRVSAVLSSYFVGVSAVCCFIYRRRVGLYTETVRPG